MLKRNTKNRDRGTQTAGDRDLCYMTESERIKSHTYQSLEVINKSSTRRNIVPWINISRYKKKY